jgi:hypothetical protein
MLSFRWVSAVYVSNWFNSAVGIQWNQTVSRGQSDYKTSVIRSNSPAPPPHLRYTEGMKVNDLPLELKHPDIWKPSAADLEQEACFTSWISYQKLYQQIRPLSIPRNQVTKSSVLVWETIQSFGINSTSTIPCDGIPRLKFLNITSSSPKLVTVTVWSDDTDFDFFRNRLCGCCAHLY